MKRLGVCNQLFLLVLPAKGHGSAVKTITVIKLSVWLQETGDCTEFNYGEQQGRGAPGRMWANL